MSKTAREKSRRERAAAIQKASARSERNRRMAIVGGVVVALAIIIAGAFWFSGGSDNASTHVPNKASASLGTLQGAPAKTVATVTSDAGDTPTLLIGKPSAKIKVVVYEDFLCPYCREFEMSSRDFLHADAAKGEVQVNYRPFHLLQPQYSTDALNAFAAVLKTSSPQVALKFHDLLYDNQPYEAASSFPTADDLASWAKKAGADPDPVRKAVQANDPSYEQAANALAKKSGLTGTPTVFVNGKQLSGRSVTDMAQNLEKMINSAYQK